MPCGGGYLATQLMFGIKVCGHFVAENWQVRSLWTNSLAVLHQQTICNNWYKFGLFQSIQYTMVHVV